MATRRPRPWWPTRGRGAVPRRPGVWHSDCAAVRRRPTCRCTLQSNARKPTACHHCAGRCGHTVRATTPATRSDTEAHLRAAADACDDVACAPDASVADACDDVARASDATVERPTGNGKKRVSSGELQLPCVALQRKRAKPTVAARVARAHSPIGQPTDAVLALRLGGVAANADRPAVAVSCATSRKALGATRHRAARAAARVAASEARMAEAKQKAAHVARSRATRGTEAALRVQSAQAAAQQRKDPRCGECLLK